MIGDACGSVTDNNNNYVESDHTYSVPSLNCLKDREYENRKQLEQSQTTIVIKRIYQIFFKVRLHFLAKKDNES